MYWHAQPVATVPAVAATELDLSTLSTNVSSSTKSNLAIAASRPS